jgi:hypothetical protein
VGTVATGVLSVRAGMKYSEIIRQEEIRRTAEATADHSPGPVTITDKAKLVGVHFIPPVVVGGLTITSVVMAHRMSAAKAAALAAAYGVTQRQFEEYKAKVTEKLTGRYFTSTMEKIERAVNAVNAEINLHGYCPAAMFYDELELPPTTWTDDVGWNRECMAELAITTTMAPDNKPCLAIDFVYLPKLDYQRMY